MNTALVFGNGSLLVNVNNSLNISDLYFPHVGQENHLAKLPNELFLYVDGSLTKLTDGNWKITPAYKKDSLVSYSEIRSERYQLMIFVESFVLPDKNIFIRNFTVKNLSHKQRNVLFYVKNNFYMLEDDVGNTAIWYPVANVMCHYKKNRYIGVGSTGSIYQFTCAAPTDNHGKGAFPNEKGELWFNPVTTGSAQSCLSYKLDIPSNSQSEFDSFLVCGMSFEEITALANYVRENGTKDLAAATDKYWTYWVGSKIDNYFGAHPPVLFGDKELDGKLMWLYKRSLLTIRTQFDNGGAIVAANDSTFLKAGGKDTYSYFWPRDGAFVAMALIDVGFGGLVKRFFRYCKNILNKDGYILHKYYPDITDGLASSWHPWLDKGGNLQLPIQEDETALVIYALWKHFERFGDQEFLNEMWHDFVVPAAEFLVKYRYSHELEGERMSSFVTGYMQNEKENPLDKEYAHSGLPRPSYDLWEIERGIFTYTVSSVYAGLTAASRLAEFMGNIKFKQVYEKAAAEIKQGALQNLLNKNSGRFVKSIYCDPVDMICAKDDSLDSSMYALWSFGMLPIDDPAVVATMRAIEEKLWVKTEIGGMARKENDWYHRTDDNLQGNPWYICTLWMAQYWLVKGNKENAKRYIKWVLDHADSTGLIPEQADPYTGFATSVKPLTWSHAEFVRTVNLLKT